MTCSTKQSIPYDADAVAVADANGSTLMTPVYANPMHRYSTIARINYHDFRLNLLAHFGRDLHFAQHLDGLDFVRIS